MLQIEHIPLATLTPADYNPRKIADDQMAALMRSLAEFGWVDPVVVNTRSGLIVGGHQRVEAAKRLHDKAKGKAKEQWARVPVTYVDLDEGKEQALNVALNKISGEFDLPKLAELLQGLDVDDFALTGFLTLELDNLLADMPAVTDGENDAEAEWQGMPAFSQDDETGIKAIVHFANNDDKASFEKLIGQKIPSNTKAIWFPEKKWENMRDAQWVSDNE